MTRRIDLDDAAPASPAPSRSPTAGAVFAFPTSFAQERIWFFDRMHPCSALYNSPMAFRLSGELDGDALARALDDVAARHDALRTTFRTRDGTVEQVVHEVLRPRVERVDLAHAADPEREASAWRLATALAREPFDLERDSPLRALLVRLGTREHLLVVVVHHIAADGWSVRILFEELSAAYRTHASGATAELPGVSVQYPDYAVWHRAWLDGGVSERQMRYWRTALAGMPEVLELPADRPRPPALSYAGGTLTMHIPSDVVRGLSRLAAEESASLFMVLLAALDVLLHRLTGESRIAVGAPIVGRARPELERTVGFFSNTVVYCTDCSGSPTFRHLLARVRDVSVQVFEHQDVPFQRVVEALHPARDPSRSPLFQVMLALQPALEGALLLPDVRVTPIPIDTGTAKFDLQMELQETPDGLRGVVEYASDLFDAETASRLAARFELLLRGILAAPDARIAELPLLDDAERRLVVEEWNATAAPYPRDATVPALVAARAAETPNAVAIEDTDGTVTTYRGLRRRAAALAERLRAGGVAPGDVVAIAVERSAELVASVLGVLEAGAVYLPLDPACPDARIALMLEDAGARVLLAPRPLQSRLSFAGVRMDPAEATAADAAGELPPVMSAAGAGDPAYVMYTSGSTGRPKGVVVPHRAIVRLVLGTDYVALGPGDVVAHVSNPAFDAATFEIWGALLNGARLAVIARDTAVSPEALAGDLAARGVSTMFLTAALFNRVAAARPDAFRTMRTLMVGGEALDPHSVARVLAHHPPRRLVNGYGPTETTTFAVTHEIRAVNQGAARIPIGRPIANTRAYVLDACGAPVGVGMVGDLWIGGDGVALGYLRRPELTAERFRPDPFSPDPAARLYRTGDLARWLPDGTLDCLGRMDRQVKLRGYRIELGEIEAALRAEPGVRDALVVVRELEDGDRRLVGYVVGEERLPLERVRGRLEQILPDYMVPSALVPVPGIPVTTNGKVDVGALPPPSAATPAAGAASALPRDTLEMQLALMWQDVLRCGPVGVHDDFFELGGHSLLAAQLLDEVRAVFGRQLPLVTLFRAPTVARLAGVLRGEEDAEDASLLVPLRRHGRRPPFVLVHRTGGHLLFYRPLVLRLHQDQPVYGLQAPAHEHLTPRYVPVEERAARYVEALRQVDPTGPYYLGGSSFGGIVAYEMARQLEASGARVALLALFDVFPSTLLAQSRVARTWRWLARRVAATSRRARRLAAMSGAERVAAVRRVAGRALGGEAGQPGTGESDASSLPRRRRIAELLRQAYIRYPMRPYRGRVTLLRAAVHAQRGAAPPADLGWRRWVSDLEVVVVPGDHMTMLDEPYVAHAAAVLEARLEAARQTAG